MNKKVLFLTAILLLSAISCKHGTSSSDLISSSGSSEISSLDFNSSSSNQSTISSMTSSFNSSSISSSQAISSSQNVSSSSFNSSISSVNSSMNLQSSVIEQSSSSINSATSSSSQETVLEKFTVTWKNYDGTILEIDEQVVKGSVPTYDGIIPLKNSSSDKRYIFSGWNPSISEVLEDTVYTATFIEIDNNNSLEGIDPIFSNDGKTVKYGFYPQTYVGDNNLISILNSLNSTTINGWYIYENEYYTKVTSKVYNSENYKFNNGNDILNNTEYWFKCEPITWNVINIENGSYYLISSSLLDVQAYYDSYQNRTNGNQVIYANNYENSSIRTWLNGEFYNTAFALNSSYINQTNVDNSSLTTNISTNKYSCSNTLDKVFLPSYKDYINTSFGFENDVNNVSSSRECKTTDYSRAMGAWSNEESKYLNNGTYWTRSPSSEYKYTSWIVNSAGYLTNYAVDGTSHCVRPAITITLN